ncbi:MAG: transcriptional repressor, partial [Ilumatobacter sp.]|nr:transcriptional repressor [Ilumatobacter sp.]MCB0984764.1 transcriptional repressor [Ilumatobacter sp.]
MRNPAELTSAFRARGLKVTPQRQLLFRLLHGNTAHPSAEALFALAHAEMPGISLRTVYQTLTDLAAMGELESLSLGGATRFDPNTDPHHHAQCSRCGALHDVYVEQLDCLEVRGLDGFTPNGATIVFSGLCAACTTLTHTPVGAEAEGHARVEQFSTPT